MTSPANLWGLGVYFCGFAWKIAEQKRWRPEWHSTWDRRSTTTLGALRRANVRRALPRLFTDPFRAVWNNRRLIRSMVRRDILARYRGSFGDLLWTVLNPLLLMSTYLFVFGVVLRTRFGADS